MWWAGKTSIISAAYPGVIDWMMVRSGFGIPFTGDWLSFRGSAPGDLGSRQNQMGSLAGAARL